MTSVLCLPEDICICRGRGVWIRRQLQLTLLTFFKEETLTEGEKKAERPRTDFPGGWNRGSRWHLRETEEGQEPGFLLVFTLALSGVLFVCLFVCGEFCFALLCFALEVQSRIHPFMCFCF